MKQSGIYIHIPFCDHKCIYCDFYSIIRYDDVEKYLKAILHEIDLQAQKFSAGRKIETIYFGGGTPSFMSVEYIDTILNFVQNKFKVSEDAEITLETNPGTVSKTKLSEFKSIGINRLSVGVQSFDPDELKFLTRIHDPKTAILTIESGSEAGFENINLDLIFNLPGQSKERWKFNLETAASLPVKHISAYSLILERGTILNKMVLDGKVQMHDSDFDADLYEFTIDFLQKKEFNQYEVSNFAKEGFECLHNKIYWDYKEYLGFGTSAHSFIENKRWWNYSALNFYISSVLERNEAASGSELLDKKLMEEEYVMLALRSGGLKLNELNNRFGNAWYKRNELLLENYISSGFFQQKDNFLKFTKKGYTICDEILSNLR